jgi:hypothetical protein
VVAPDESVAAAARAKRLKVLRFLRRAREERDGGKAAPETAHERYCAFQRKARHDGAVRDGSSKAR